MSTRQVRLDLLAIVAVSSGISSALETLKPNDLCVLAVTLNLRNGISTHVKT